MSGPSSAEKSPAPASQGALHAACLFAIALASLLAYANSFHADFIFDDFQNFHDNARLHWDELRLDDIIAGVTGGPTRRPVAIFSLGMNYYVGGREVFGYHLFNFAVHLSASLAVYALMWSTLQLPGLRSARTSAKSWTTPTRAQVFSACLFAALLFALHPLQTQAVTYVVQRMTSMAAAFYLAAFLFYLYAVRPARGLKRAFGFVGLFVLYGLGLGSKEIAAPLPLALWLYEWVFGQRLDAAWARRNAVWLALPLLLFAGGFAYLYDSFQLEFSARDYSMSERLLTQTRVVWFYASMLVLPLPSRHNLLHVVPTSHSLTDPITTLLSILALLASLAAICWLLPRRPLSAFGGAWFFLHLGVESSVIPLEMIFEHRVYLPAVGASFFIADLFLSIDAKRLRDAQILGTCAALALGLLSYARNDLWRDAERLWADSFQKTGDPRALESVSWAIEADGMRLMQEGRERDAIDYFVRAASIAPLYYRVQRNWGDALMRLGRDREAVPHYRKAIELKADSTRNRMQLGYALLRLQRFDEAKQTYAEALKRKPTDRNVIRVASDFDTFGFKPQARSLLRAQIERVPDSVDLRDAYAELLSGAELHQEALEQLEAIARIGSQDVSFQARRGLALWLTGRDAEAIDALQAASTAEAGDTQHQNNLAWMLATTGDASRRNPERALALAKAVLAEKPRDSDANDARAAALAALGRFDEAARLAEATAEALEASQPTDEEAQQGLRKRAAKYRRGEVELHEVSPTQAESTP